MFILHNINLITIFYTMDVVLSVELGVVSFLATLLVGIIFGTISENSSRKTNLKRNSVYTTYGKKPALNKNYSSYSKAEADRFKEKSQKAAENYKNNASGNTASRFNQNSNVTAPIRNAENMKNINGVDAEKQRQATRIDGNNRNIANYTDHSREFKVDSINIDNYRTLNNNQRNSSTHYNNTNRN